MTHGAPETRSDSETVTRKGKRQPAKATCLHQNCSYCSTRLADAENDRQPVEVSTQGHTLDAHLSINPTQDTRIRVSSVAKNKKPTDTEQRRRQVLWAALLCVGRGS